MSDDASELRLKLESLRRLFLKKLPEKLTRIQTLMKVDQASLEVIKELQRAMHSLAGSAGTYGFHELGEAAHRSETQLMLMENEGTTKEGSRDVAVQAVSEVIGIIERHIETQVIPEVTDADLGTSPEKMIQFVIQD